MSEAEEKAKTLEVIPAEAESDIAARGQHESSGAISEQSVERAKGTLPASSMYSALDALILNEPRKYGVLMLFRFLSAWARNTADSAERQATLREENAALRARIQGDAKNRPLRVVALLFGPILGAMGLDQLRHDHLWSAVVLILMGLLLVGMAIYLGSPRDGDT